MKKARLSFLLTGWMALLAWPLFAQTPQAVPTEAADEGAAVSQDGVSQEAVSETDESSEEAAFKPHWSGQLALTYSNQPSSGGGGQVTKEFGMTGTYNISEAGDSFNLGMAGGQQKVEGVDTNYGSLTLGGSLGIGIFQPSLSFTLQQGASALNSDALSLTLDFQVVDGLTLGPTGGLGLENHQGPASQIYPNTPSPDSTLEVDSGNWTLGVAASAVPWDFLTLDLTLEQETTDTFQTQNLLHTTSKALNQGERIPSATLETLVTFLKDFQFQVSGQYGREYYSAGTQYSPVLGKTVTFTKPTQNDFTGFTLGLLYNFQ